MARRVILSIRLRPSRIVILLTRYRGHQQMGNGRSWNSKKTYDDLPFVRSRPFSWGPGRSEMRLTLPQGDGCSEGHDRPHWQTKISEFLPKRSLIGVRTMRVWRRVAGCGPCAWKPWLSSPGQQDRLSGLGASTHSPSALNPSWKMWKPWQRSKT